MKRLIAFIIAVAMLAGSFYVAWPGWTLHRIAEAIREEDPATLEQAVDFLRVRASLHGPLTEEVTRHYDQFSSGRSRGVFAAQIKGEVLPRLVESTLDAVAAPANVIFIARNRVGLKEAVQRALEQRIILGSSFDRTPPLGLGALAGRQPSTGGDPRRPGQAPRYTLSNIKGIALIGPLEFEIGINREATAAEPEMLLHMAFTGASGWRVVGVIPRL